MDNILSLIKKNPNFNNRALSHILSLRCIFNSGALFTCMCVAISSRQRCTSLWSFLLESSWFQSTAATVCGLSYETEAWAIFLTPLLLHTFQPVRGPAGMELAMAGCEGGGLNLNLGE